MRRREFLWMAGGAAFAGEPSVLVHEHILVDFVGADQIRPGRYDPDEVFRIARPKLEEVKKLGCRRLLECTPNFLGRDPNLLARLSDAHWSGDLVEHWLVRRGRPQVCPRVRAQRIGCTTGETVDRGDA